MKNKNAMYFQNKQNFGICALFRPIFKLINNQKDDDFEKMHQN